SCSFARTATTPVSPWNRPNLSISTIVCIYICRLVNVPHFYWLTGERSKGYNIPITTLFPHSLKSQEIPKVDVVKFTARKTIKVQQQGIYLNTIHKFKSCLDPFRD
ncbi:unnamed protein product, partial [Penicillium nalgiovense]